MDYYSRGFDSCFDEASIYLRGYGITEDEVQGMRGRALEHYNSGECQFPMPVSVHIFNKLKSEYDEAQKVGNNVQERLNKLESKCAFDCGLQLEDLEDSGIGAVGMYCDNCGLDICADNLSELEEKFEEFKDWG